jgi:DNA-binding beta-propeller fold protein YncE/mono/diheme cytochrome c family protein
MRKLTLGLVLLGFAIAACESEDPGERATTIDLSDTDALLARGRTLYQTTGECWDCHGTSGEGGDAPSLTHGPSAYDIHYQLNTNPEMADTRERLQATREDMIALAVYTRDLVDLEINDNIVADLVASMESARENPDPDAFPLTARDRLVNQIASFDTVIEDWQRRAKSGSLKSTYEIRVARTYERGAAKFTPEPGKVYFYEATGPGQAEAFGVPSGGGERADSVQVIVGDATTKEVIAHYAFPPEMRAAVHSTAVTPDGRYVYVTGPRPSLAGTADRPVEGLDTPATIIKADALTLQPVEQLVVGGRMHHAQIFQDRLMLVDTFARDRNGLDIFLMDPVTDQVVGGIRDEDLGGVSYTAFTDDESIYILMEPGAYGPGAGYRAADRFNRGQLAAIRPFWVAKVDPSTWEVVREYPYPGYRANWIVIDSAKENIYVSSGANSFISKISLETGEIVWTSPTGTGPYGASLNADESEIWVADKGETRGMFGRTITVIDTVRGRQLETVFSGYQVDHVLLSPNGREMWATSNAEGKIYVFDAATREQTHVIDMPGFGDPHGLVFVWYDDSGEPHVVRDQGGFHSGVHPVRGAPLAY